MNRMASIMILCLLAISDSYAMGAAPVAIPSLLWPNETASDDDAPVSPAPTPTPDPAPTESPTEAPTEAPAE